MTAKSVFSLGVRSRRAKRAIVASLFLIALVASGLWALSRETTLIHAANALSERLDGRLQTVDLHGSLLGTITAGELRYQDRFGKVAIKDARLEWRPIRLLIGQVAVGAMAADTVTLELAKSEDPARKPPESLAAPISFAVTDFQIGTLSIVRPDATQEIRGLRAAFSGNSKQLQAQVKSLATQYGALTGELRIGAESPFALDGSVELAAPDPHPYVATATLGGSLLNAEILARAQARDAIASATLAVAPYEAQPLTELEFTAQDFDPRIWVANAPGAKLSGEGRLAAGEGRRLAGTFDFKNSEPGTIDDKKLPFAQLSAVLQGTLEELVLSDIKLDLASAGRFAGAGAWRDGALDVNLDTRSFNLRGVQKRLYQTNLVGTLSLGGDAAAQRMRFNLTQQQYHVRFAGTLAEGIAKIDEAYARAGAAELTARGRVAFDTERSFDLAGRLRNFDPAKFGEYPTHLVNGRFDLKGHVEPVLQVAANVAVTDSKLYGLPATANGAFRSQRVDHPDVSMDVALRVGDTRASVKGIVRDPADARSMDMQLTLAGASLAELYKIAGVPLPPTPPYRIAGRLVQKGDLWEFRQFTGAVGDSDLSGDFLVDRGRTPQFMKADLKSNRLTLADLSGFIGAEKTSSGKVTTPNPNRVLPDSPYSLEKLRSADADVRFEGKQIITERLPVRNMSTHLLLKGGVLTLSPLNFGAAGGNLFSDITLDGRRPVIASRADIRVQSLQLGQLLPQLKSAKASVGEIDGRVKLTGRGNSVAAMLGTATGNTTLAIGEGEVSDLMLRLSNLDLANALLALMRGDRSIPIRCVVADLAFENGVMQPRQFVFDTAHTTLFGEGKANFADETLDLRLVAAPKSGSLLSLRGPINVTGTFAHPSAMPDIGRLAARAGGAVALAAIATPLALIVPFLQTGENKDVQCGPLMQAAKQSIQQGSSELSPAGDALASSNFGGSDNRQK